MSMQAALRFRDYANANVDVQSEVTRCFAKGTIDFAGLAELGQRHGFEFTTDDAKAVLGAPSDELSEFEMELVSGGIAAGKRF